MPQYLSDEDYRDYGQDLVSFSKKAALEVVSPHIAALQEDNAQLRHHLQVQARHALDQRVAAAVPNYLEIDRDPRWHQWLLGNDVLSGRVRQELLNEAIAHNNTGRVCSFFRQFENQAASQASYYGGSTSGKRTYSRAQIKQLYENHRRGDYAGRDAEWQRQEQDILAASREGRVLDPDRISK